MMRGWTCIVSLILAAWLPSPALATDWYVDWNNCPGGTGTLGDPFCTVGQGLAVAQNGDRILIAPGTYGENLILTADVTLVGSLIGAVVLDGGWQDRVIDVPAGVTAELRWLRIERGKHFDQFAAFGGGILNAGDLTLRYCRVASSYAFASTYFIPGNIQAQGGGIYNSGTLLLESCTIANNSSGASAWSGQELIEGMGVFNSGTLVMTGCAVVDNDGATDSIMSQGVGGGGGVCNTGTLAMTNCTIAWNDLVTTNSSGGGISTYLGTTSLTSCTVAENTVGGAVQGGDGCASGGGIAGTVSMTHTIVAYNDVWTDGWWCEAGEDIQGAVVSGGYNLVQDRYDYTITGDLTGNQIGVDPLLAGLRSRGGPVWTYGLAPTSPALDAGDPTPLNGQPVDSRNYGRALSDPAVGACDIGAFEDRASSAFLLASTPAVISLGAPFQLTSTGGWPEESLFLFLVEVGGVPTFLPVTRGPIDFQGVWRMAGTAPADPSVSGMSVKLRGLSLSANGQFLLTNDASLSFQ